MSHQLEIILSKTNDEHVQLDSMSPDELGSFIAVISSLKSIAVSMIKQDDLKFSIFESSAGFAIEAPQSEMNSFYEEVELAMRGECEVKEVTDNLRTVQKQLQNEIFGYSFLYKKRNDDPSPVILHDRIIKAKEIRKRKKRTAKPAYKLLYLKGLLQEIGGKNPNYHLDYIKSESITVDCSIEEAKVINGSLYDYISVIVLCKEAINSDEKNKYFHKVLLNSNLANRLVDKLLPYFERYYMIEDDLVEQLTLTYDLIDEAFEENKEEGFQILRVLLIAFNDKNFHLSELKTLLVISAPFKKLELIKDVRMALLETYEKKNK